MHIQTHYDMHYDPERRQIRYVRAGYYATLHGLVKYGTTRVEAIKNVIEIYRKFHPQVK